MFKKEFIEIIGGFKKALGVLEGKEKRALLIASVVMIVTGFLTNIPALLLGHFVDSVVSDNLTDFSLAVPFIAVMSGVLIVKEALTVWRKYLVENVATQSEKHMTVLLLDHVLKLESSILSSKHIGALHGRMVRSVQGLIRMIKLGFLDFLPAFFTAITALIIVATQKQLMAGFMILVVPAGLYIVMLQIASQKGIRVALLREKERIDGTTIEMLGGIETIRASNTSDIEVHKVEAVAERLRLIEIKHHIQMAFYDAAKYLNEAFFYVLVVSISIYFATTGVISTGDILTYSILFMSVITPLRSVHRILDEAHESSIKIADLNEILASPEDISYATKDNKLTVNQMEAMRIEGVSFAYGKVQILNDINLAIRKGEKIGLVGASGCGKSTLVKVLLRLLHDYDGTVSVIGENLTTLSRRNLAELIAYVPQQPFIFSGTVRENLLYGNEGLPTDIDLHAVLEKVNLVGEFNSEGGLDYVITERGGNISGGQRQRIAIARLLLKKPKIVILDEATAALDNTNEALVHKSITDTFADATIIIIAHRLTTLKNMDRIIVFENGGIAEEGTYNDLAIQDGLFRKFLEESETQ